MGDKGRREGRSEGGGRRRGGVAMRKDNEIADIDTPNTHFN